jgi:hypothetical protein
VLPTAEANARALDEAIVRDVEGPKGSWFVGLDERTAILGDGIEWRLFRVGSVSVRHAGGTNAYRAGDAFESSDPPA